MIFFLYRKNDPYLEVAPLGIFTKSFLRHNEPVSFYSYSQDKEDRLLKSLASGDVVYFYNMSQRNKQELLKKMSRRGAVVVNTPTCYGKQDCGKSLVRSGIPVPEFITVGPGKVKRSAINRIGLPFVIKPVYGAGGKGVTVVESEKDIPHSIEVKSIIQKYIPEGSKSILRINVVDGKAVGAMIVKNESDTKVCNLSINADPEPYDPTEEESMMAVQATKAVGLDISGVDMVQSTLGTMVLEVNAVPGFRGVSVAGMEFQDYIVDLIVKKHQESAIDRPKNF
jgi:RimK family alpha-L-glutamate ligase